MTRIATAEGTWIVTGPQRTRSHELETLSERAFESTVPIGWVARPVMLDYGIDREVEVFENGQATGFTCKVQLKATQGIVDTSALRRRVPVTTYAYWLNLDVPVLIVLFDANQNRLYYKWAHQHDPQRRRQGDRKSTTIAFSPENELTPQIWPSLAKEITLVRAVRRGAIPSRHIVQVHQEGQLSVPEDASLRLVLKELAAGAKHSGGLLTVELEPTEAQTEAIDIYFAGTYVRVEMPTGHPTLTFHSEPRWLTSYNHQMLASDAILQIAMLLAEVRAYSQATRLIELAAATSSAVELPHLSIRLLGILEYESARDTAGGICAALLLRDTAHSREMAEMYWMCASSGQQLRPETYRFVLDGYIQLSDRPASSSYNASQVALALGEWSKMIELLDDASVKDPTYLERDYWHKDRAAALWQLGRYSEAADHYVHQADLNGDSTVLLPLAAEGYILGGDLVAATRCHVRLAHSVPDVDSDLFVEISLILQALRSLIGPAVQIPPAQIESRPDSALPLTPSNALDPNVLVRVVGQTRNGLTTLGAALLAAKLVNSAPELWALTLVIAVDIRVTDSTLAALFKSALQKNEMETLVSISTVMAESNGVAGLRARLDKLRLSADDDRDVHGPPTFTMRFVGDDGDVTSFDIHR